MPGLLRSIPKGSDLVVALTEAFAKKAGWIQAVGEVEAVDLRLADTNRSYPGRYTLVQLGGPAGGPYGALLARAEGVATDLVAGTLVRARVVEVRVVWLAAAPEALPAEQRPGTQGAPATPAHAMKWGAQAAARARALESEAAEDEGGVEWIPELGDLVQHFAFGVCEVVSVDGDKLTIRDLSGGRIRELRTRHLRIEAPTEQDGRRLFRLSKRD